MPLGDVSQTNRAPDWLAPSITAMPPANPHTPGIWAWWETSRVGNVSEVLFSQATLYATALSPSTTQRGGHFSFWDPSRSQPESPSRTLSTLYILQPSIPRAQYLLLIDHYLATGYTPAGTTVTEGIEIPIGWIPTLAVDPLNTLAIQNFWNAGPPQFDSEVYRDQYQPGIPLFRRPVVYWQFVSPGTFILTGPGATLGNKSSG